LKISSFITLIGGIAMAGAVGADGLSDLALRYDYIQWDTPGIKATFIFLIIIVQLIQSLDTKNRKKLMKLRA
jgi:D-methionine transport system permease protein